MEPIYNDDMMHSIHNTGIPSIFRGSVLDTQLLYRICRSKDMGTTDTGTPFNGKLRRMIWKVGNVRKPNVP